MGEHAVGAAAVGDDAGVGGDFGQPRSELVERVADALGLTAAVWAVAVLTAASGLLAAARMYETRTTS